MRWFHGWARDAPRLGVHGFGAIAAGLVLALEDRAGYVFPVFDGPKGIFAWTRFEPLSVWGVVFILAGALVLSGNRATAMTGLFAVIGAWGAFGGAVLITGASSPNAAMFSGVGFLTIAFGAMQRLIELAAKAPAPPEASG